MRRNHDAAGRSFFDGWAGENTAALNSDAAEREAGRGRLRVGAVASSLAAVAVAGGVLAGSSAVADPSAHTWHRLRMCESGNNYAINTGNGYYGAYQFDLPTWRSVGGTGYPNRAARVVQDERALILYRERGWEPWTCARILGLRPDSDAASGRTSDIHVRRPVSRARIVHVRRSAARTRDAHVHRSQTRTGHVRQSASRTHAPAFPGGSHWYFVGDTSRGIKRFQDQMHRRGAIPAGTGYYGPLTLRVVKRLQQLNGLVPNGLIGPNTWHLAWVGRYAPPGTPMAAIPEFPGGAHWYFSGDTSRGIKQFQDQMHRRGAIPAGTGYYGPLTLHVVKRLQRLNGLVPNGYIGPNTWRLAWVGKY